MYKEATTQVDCYIQNNNFQESIIYIYNGKMEHQLRTLSIWNEGCGGSSKGAETNS